MADFVSFTVFNEFSSFSPECSLKFHVKRIPRSQRNIAKEHVRIYTGPAREAGRAKVKSESGVHQQGITELNLESRGRMQTRFHLWHNDKFHVQTSFEAWRVIATINISKYVADHPSLCRRTSFFLQNYGSGAHIHNIASFAEVLRDSLKRIGYHRLGVLWEWGEKLLTREKWDLRVPISSIQSWRTIKEKKRDCSLAV